jgi:hypothetical protein
MKAKIHIFNCDVKWVLLYGCEDGKVSTHIAIKLQTFVN